MGRNPNGSRVGVERADPVMRGATLGGAVVTLGRKDILLL